MGDFLIRSLTVMAALIPLAAAAGGQGVEVADFLNQAVPVGWTVTDGEYRSPEYSNAVNRIELAYAGEGLADLLAVYALPLDGADVQIAALSPMSSSAAFDFPDSIDVRAFRIVAPVGAHLKTFVAYVAPAELDAPVDVSVTNNITGTSFDASWSAVPDSTGYRVYVWTNLVVNASAGTEVWCETFSDSPEKTSSTDFSMSFADIKEGWVWYKVYASVEAGAIRIGNTSAKGVLVLPPMPEIARRPFALRIRARRQDASDGTDMPVGVVSGDRTNIVDVVTLGSAYNDFHVMLPALSENDRIALFSPTNKSSARAMVDEVAVVSGYSAGETLPNYIVNGLDVGGATSCSLTGLPSEPVWFAVSAYGRRGAVSRNGGDQIVDLSSPEPVECLAACPVKSLSDGVYLQDFDSLAELTFSSGDKKWLNGTTLLFWNAWQDGEAAAKFTYNGGKAPSSGFYALAADRADDTRAFGARTKLGTTMTWGLAFTNDADVAVALTNIAYSAQQWGFANTNVQTLALSCLVTNRLDWTVNFEEGWRACAQSIAKVFDSGGTHDTPVSTAVNYVPERGVRILPGEVLYLRWTFHPPERGSSSLMAIDDLSVMFSDDVRPFRISIR